jgi:hypothetical protein
MDAQFDYVISMPNDDERQPQFHPNNNISPSQQQLTQHDVAQQQSPHQAALARRGSRKKQTSRRNAPHLSRAIGGSIAGGATTASVYGASTVVGETDAGQNTAQLLLEDNLEERLLSHVSMWDRRFINPVIESEFVMYFNRSRLPSLLCVGLQTVLVIAILVSGSPEQSVFLGLCLTSLVLLGICVCSYVYLYIERMRLNKGEHDLRPHPSPLSAAVDGGQDKFPDVWFRSEVLLATNYAWRNALRQNALNYERVTYMLTVSYALVLAGTIWLKSSCSSSILWGAAPTGVQRATCRNSILFESSYVASMCFFVVVTPQRFHQLFASLGTVYLVAMLCPLLPGISEVPWSQYVSLVVLYTLSSAIVVTCVYCLEQKKRDEFKQVVWSCAVAEQSQSLRRQEVRLTKAAFPFDVDAFLWEQEHENNNHNNPMSPSTPPPLNSVSAAVINCEGIPLQLLSLRTRSLVIAESLTAVVCVAKMDRYFAWSVAQSPKYLIAALQVMFTAIDELTALNADPSADSSVTSPTLDNSWGSARETGHSTSSRRNGTTGVVGEAGSINSSSSLFNTAKEKILKSTYGDAFLVVAFPYKCTTSSPATSTTVNNTSALSRNPLSLSTNTSTMATMSKRSSTMSLIKRMIHFGVLCMVNGNDAMTAWNAKRDPERMNRLPLIVATVSTGRVVAAASGGARGVHVHFAGEPVADALSPGVRHNRGVDLREDSAALRSPTALQGFSVVVRTEAQTAAAIDALKELGTHRVATDEPFSIYFPFGAPSTDASLAGDPQQLEPVPPRAAVARTEAGQHHSASDVMLNTSVGGGCSGTAPLHASGSHPQQRSFSSNFSVSFRRRVDGMLVSKRLQDGSDFSQQVALSTSSQRKNAGNVVATPQKRHQHPSRGQPDVPLPSAHLEPNGDQPSLDQSQQPEMDSSTKAETQPQPQQGFMTRLRAAFGFVLFTPFPDETVEAQCIAETRAFNVDRLRFAAVCGILVAAILITAETVSVTKDSVLYDSVTEISLTNNGLIWFILCAAWCLLILALCAVFAASAAIATYYVLFVLYAVCYCIGVFLSADGSVVRNSPVVWLMLLDALSVMRPPWEHVGIATIPDLVFLVVFLLRNQRMFADAGIMPGKLSRAFTAQLVSTHVLYFAIRVIHERMERSFFATRLEAAEYTRQIERHVVALDDIIRTIAPDKRVARELSRTLHRVVERQQNIRSGAEVHPGSAEAVVAKAKVSVLSSSVHDSCLLLVRFSGTKNTSITERDFLHSKCMLHSALLHFVDSQEDDEQYLPEGGHESFFVLDHLETLGATVVCNTGPPLMRCLRMIRAVMAATTKHGVCTATIGSGVQIGAVISVGTARFDIYGSAIVALRQLMEQLAPGSIIATSRFRLYEEQEIRREATIAAAATSHQTIVSSFEDDDRKGLVGPHLQYSEPMRFSVAGGVSLMACFLSI